jgi:hypothetical protein
MESSYNKFNSLKPGTKIELLWNGKRYTVIRYSGYNELMNSEYVVEGWRKVINSVSNWENEFRISES